MGIIIFIIFGALVGWVASMVMGGGGGLLWNVAVGIIGAVLGGFVMNMVGQSGVGEFSMYSFLVALLGACILIVIVRAVKQ
jgi:uncharacterized membrane protein YeaQ/YmgE (transglycosylase-associated protein family)